MVYIWALFIALSCSYAPLGAMQKPLKKEIDPLEQQRLTKKEHQSLNNNVLQDFFKQQNEFLKKQQYISLDTRLTKFGNAYTKDFLQTELNYLKLKHVAKLDHNVTNFVQSYNAHYYWFKPGWRSHALTAGFTASLIGLCWWIKSTFLD
ncbi:MAG: hypothetical protein AB7R69_01300 [Candidatus Babeliales bacterium]